MAFFSVYKECSNFLKLSHFQVANYPQMVRLLEGEVCNCVNTLCSKLR